MGLTANFEAYIAAFNAGDSAAYTCHYARDIVLINGAGDELHGPEAIRRFYDRSRARMERHIEVMGVIEGRQTIAAVLQSRFKVVADSATFAGRELVAGDTVLLRSFALYEIEGDLFKRIQARTLAREFLTARSA